MQKISTCLWFDGQAEEAAQFYVSIFKNSKIGTITHNTEETAQASGRPKGSVLTITFQLDGRDFMGLNGGPEFKFTEAVSFVVNCETQEELDDFWKKLTAGGQEVACGWLKDKYGVSWQIVPIALNEMLKKDEPVKMQKVMKALMQMKKLDIKKLQDAYNS